MKNLTATEKALTIIAKQIKELDSNALLLDELNCPISLSNVRNELFEIIAVNGYTLEFKTYKLIKNKE